VIRWISSHRKSGLGGMPCRHNLRVEEATLFDFSCDTRDGKVSSDKTYTLVSEIASEPEGSSCCGSGPGE